MDADVAVEVLLAFSPLGAERFGQSTLYDPRLMLVHEPTGASVASFVQ